MKKIGFSKWILALATLCLIASVPGWGSPAEAAQGRYAVLIGSFSTADRAESAARELEARGLAPVVANRGANGPFEILIGNFGSAKEARSAARWLREDAGINPAVRRAVPRPVLAVVTVRDDIEPLAAATPAEIPAPVRAQSAEVPAATGTPAVVSAQAQPVAAPERSSSQAVPDPASEPAGDYYLAAPETAGDGWGFGAGLLGQWTFQDRTVSDTQASDRTDSGRFLSWGGRIWAGKGPYSLSAEYLRGQNTYHYDTTSGGTAVKYDLDSDAWELKVKGRYLFAGQGEADRIVPYAVGGALYVNEEQSYRITTGNATFSSTGTPNLKRDVRIFGAEAGGGAIIPMGPRWGFQLEGALIYAQGEVSRDGVTDTWTSRSSTGLGVDALGLVYWAITPNLGLTAGGEYRHIEFDDSVGRFGRFGITTSLDFSF